MKRAASAGIDRSKRRSNRGFALATVLIASTVMLTVLTVSVQATATIRQSLLNQYYTGLARTAAESGIAYAKSCLAANTSNPGAPAWTSTRPLMVNTGCDGNVPATPASAANCFASSNTAGCTVTSNGDITTNFSVGYPLVNTDASSTSYGDAISLQSTGIVNVLRTSQVGTSTPPWRTYQVTVSANLVTPNLCSPYNTTTTGWNNVTAVSPSTHPISGYSAYQITTTATGLDLPGVYYYEADFSVATAGTYTLAEIGADRSEVSIDGVLEAESTNAIGTGSVSLTAGCHTVVARISNSGDVLNATGVTIAIRQSGATSDILDTEDEDTKWRVTTGSTVDYSQYNYYDDQLTGWGPIRVLAPYNTSSVWGAPTNWISSGGSANADWINSTYTLEGAGPPYSPSYDYPTYSYINLRSTQGFTSVGTDPVKIVAACDNSCVIYVDGNQVLGDTTYTSATTTTLTNLTAGPHEIAALLYNTTTSSGFLLTAYDTTTGAVLSNSDGTWESTNAWSSTIQDPQSYDSFYIPSTIPTAPRGVNIAPPFSLWTLSGGATYSSSTGQLTLPSAGYAISPLIEVDSPSVIADGGDFYASSASPYASFTPKGGNQVSIYYYEANETTPAINSTNYTANGCAQSLTLSVWSNSDMRCTFYGGPNVIYEQYYLVGSAGGYASPNLVIRNPNVKLTD